jgi:DNA-binding response OmpR family regulator
MMPGESSLELARDLRTISNVAIYLLTAPPEPQTSRRSELGVNEFVPNPFEPPGLLRLQTEGKRGRGQCPPRAELKMGDCPCHRAGCAFLAVVATWPRQFHFGLTRGSD